jgi:hypothetical protein
MVVPPLSGLVRLIATFSQIGSKDATMAGVEVMFPNEFSSGLIEPDGKLAQMLNASLVPEDGAAEETVGVRSAAAHFFQKGGLGGGVRKHEVDSNSNPKWTYKEAYAWAMILRGRKYVERPYEEMDLKVGCCSGLSCLHGLSPLNPCSGLSCLHGLSPLNPITGRHFANVRDRNTLYKQLAACPSTEVRDTDSSSRGRA